MRHEKLHSRPSVHGSQPLSPVDPRDKDKPATPESIQSSSRESYSSEIPNPPNPTLQHQQQPNFDSEVTQQWPELDFELIWPDAEDLFQSINSQHISDWQMPGHSLPLPFDTNSYGNSHPAEASSQRYHGSAGAPGPTGPVTSGGGGNQAVQGVSDMISNLSSSVTMQAGPTSIDSTFLDESLHMFFVKFVPTFPVLHRSTFVFKDCLHPLLLNAIAIGSLYLGPKDSIAKGEALWRLAHTAIATSWQSLLKHQGPYDPCPGVQLLIGMLLGKMYGLLSKNRQIRTTAQAFHSLGFFCASHSGMLDCRPYDIANLPTADSTKEEKENQFKLWTALEIQRRAILAHYILDGIKSHMLGESTAVRHVANQLQLPNADLLFEAGSADEWLVRMYSQQTLPPTTTFSSIYNLLFAHDNTRYSDLSSTLSTFTLRVLLEGLQSLAAESPHDTSQSPLGVPSKYEIRRALTRLYASIATNFLAAPAEKMETCLRWHSICLDLITPSSILCRFVCVRQNITQHVWSTPKSPHRDLDLIAWAHSSDGRRALLHAAAIQDIVEQLPRGRAHAIHMPSALLAAATVYCVFAIAGVITVRLPCVTDWKDALDEVDDAAVQLAELSGTPITSETTRFVLGGLPQGVGYGAVGGMRNVRYELNSLQKLFGCLGTQWGIAKDMEQVVGDWNAMCH
ncbi:hypothetical protein EJ05DRAFT_311899 [Pseudovirgaria hyperparasitica]|uniref:Xylanolytic transcriptional activator regulatory domain-containing protein n=1 Tax=Pseudovirgaria hyperparasitica TaxID=470096 RepID=A0A6A6WAZ9_9PEZI|nr:uncharacterized protein EJ05DRAFT_311899 [Pseudovirgaria hyperparasitica]KAF2759843.1 hypothetical protein EJ05DRAFT_311899 [Pseudovirgaria hyperparasitica]